jgi:hypothetical protein
MPSKKTDEELIEVKGDAPRPLDNACQELGGISKSHLYNLVNAGKLKLIRIGNRSFIPYPEIQRIQQDGI